MNGFLAFRDFLNIFYRKNESIINFVVKFSLYFYIYAEVLNLYSDVLSADHMSVITAVISVISTFTASIVSVCLIVLVICGGLYFVSLEIALAVLLVCILFFLFYSVMFPKETFLVVAIILLERMGLLYLLPIFVGVFIGIRGLFPMAFGCVFINYMHNFKVNVEEVMIVKTELEDIFTTFMTVIEQIVNLDFLPVFSVCFVGFLFSYAICKITMKYFRENAVLISGIGMFITAVILPYTYFPEFNSLAAIVDILIATLVMFVVIFFDNVLDYAQIEKLQFEDDVYYYRVVAIPKVVKPPKKEERLVYNKKVKAFSDTEIMVATTQAKKEMEEEQLKKQMFFDEE